MGRQYQMLIIILILSALNKKLLAIDNVAYIQISNTRSQLGGPSAKLVAYNIIDGSNGITIVNNDTYSFNNIGIFFGVFASQIGSPNRNGVGEVHVWIRRGSKDKPNSNSIQTVERGATSVLVYQGLFAPRIGPAGTFMFSAFTENKCSALGLISSAPENEPVVPSIITSLLQISGSINPSPHAELTSSKTQLGFLNPKVIKLTDISQISGIDTTTMAQDGIIKYTKSGLYFAIASGHVGSVIDTYASGEVHLWMRLNGEDIPNSNTIQTIRKGSTAVLISQSIFKLQANDELQLVFSTTNEKLGMIAVRPINESAAPSMIFSTFNFGGNRNSIPYAQLSSLKTQYGCLTPQGVELEQNDGSQHIKNNNGILKFKESGTYFLIAAAQVGSCEDEGIGDVHLWMRLNGQDIADSNTIQTINGDTAVLISQTIMVMQAGDKLQVMFSTDVTSGILGLIASRPRNEPAVPSMIFSAFKSSY